VTRMKLQVIIEYSLNVRINCFFGRSPEQDFRVIGLKYHFLFYIGHLNFFTEILEFQLMKTCWRSESIARHILNLGARWRSGPFTPGEEPPVRIG